MGSRAEEMNICVKQDNLTQAGVNLEAMSVHKPEMSACDATNNCRRCGV
jgi:hypothetical protein